MAESRLMEISLKIENYIYKNRPISLNDAVLYVEEVSLYKYKYANDPRISQVTEKLIRQLKAVIAEQDTTSSWNVQEVIENSMPICLPSPTYSEREIDVNRGERDPLCDDNEVGVDEASKEDNSIAPYPSLFEPITEANEAIPIESYERNTNSRVEDKTEKDETIILTDEDNIDGSNVIVTKAQNKVFNSPMKNIQRSLSQLAINPVNEEKRKPTSLRSVHKIAQGSKYYNQNLNSLEMPHRQICYGKNHYLQKITIRSEVSNGTIPTEAIANNQTITKVQQTKDTISDLPKKSRGRKKAVAKQVELNSPKEKPKRRRKNKTLKTQENDNATAKDFKSSRPQCSKKNNVIKSVIEIPSNDQSDSIRTIYNSNVENDLSWIENIRYVREIVPEENDPKLKYYDDSFWDTFELPANWSDQDFLY